MEITKGVRIVNYILDLSLIWVLSVLIYTLFKFGVNYNLIFYVTLFLYYFLFESITAKTPGKMVTKTKIVNMTNNKPSVGRVALRSILRLNPFDVFSYIFGQEQGGHDLLSRTRLIKYK